MGFVSKIMGAAERVPLPDVIIRAAIRQRLARNAGQQDQRANIVRRPQALAGRVGGDKDREC